MHVFLIRSGRDESQSLSSVRQCSAMPKIVKRLLIALVSVILCAGALELWLRWNGFEYPPVEPIQIWNRVEDRDMRLGQGLHEYAGRQLWRPRPGAEIPWGGTVNELGYRGPVLKPEKTPGVLRIATLPFAHLATLTRSATASGASSSLRHAGMRQWVRPRPDSPTKCAKGASQRGAPFDFYFTLDDTAVS